MIDPAKKIERMVSELMRRRFWGKLELAFRDGKITFVRREETERFDIPLRDTKGPDTKPEQ